MPQATAYHCTDNYLVGVLTSSDCVVSSWGIATISQPTSSPLLVQDAGDLQYMFAWSLFFLAMIFLGMVWNTAPFTK